MREQLRPMRLGEILDRTFQIYRERFLLYLGLSALAMAGGPALGLLGVVFGATLDQTTLAASTKLSIRAFGDSFLVREIPSFFRCILFPAMVLVTSSIFQGVAGGIRAALSDLAKRWRSWLALSALIWFVWVLPGSVISRVPRFQRLELHLHTTLRGVGFLWDFAYICFFEFVAFSPVCLCIPVWVVERTGVRRAVRREFTLLSGCYGRLFAAWLAWFAIHRILYSGISLATRLVADSMGTFVGVSVIKAQVLLVGILAAPIFPIAMTLIYYDQRIRKEGFDIEWLMESAGMVEAVAAPAGAVAGVETGA